MNKGKLSIFHPNMVVTKQIQLYFVLYIGHILHAGSVTVLSKQQKVREKEEKGPAFLAGTGYSNQHFIISEAMYVPDC